MGFGRKMKDCINFFLLQCVVQEIRIADVPFDKFEIRVTLQPLDGVCAGAVIQLVKRDDFVGRMLLAQASADVRANEPVGSRPVNNMINILQQ